MKLFLKILFMTGIIYIFIGNEINISASTDMLINNKIQLNIKIDEKAKNIISINEYSVDKRFSKIMGSAQQLDSKSNTYLIEWGGIINGESTVSEFDFSKNKLIFKFTFSDKHSVFGPGMYREYKFK